MYNLYDICHACMSCMTYVIHIVHSCVRVEVLVYICVFIVYVHLVRKYTHLCNSSYTPRSISMHMCIHCIRTSCIYMYIVCVCVCVCVCQSWDWIVRLGGVSDLVSDS